MIETIRTIGEPLVALLIVVGALLSAISAFGLVRLPDVYLRSHAATKSSTLGVMSILVGAFIYFAVFEELTSYRLLLAVVFVFATAPVAGHLIGRAAYRSGVPLWGKSVRDDLAKVVKGERRLEQEE
ncbi:monovalent cation/H(+) antiporter subunit G [Paenibacillus sp. TRM 82003]|nr:monovalent cation/H(+) antiporter subunit G [Paenibacillus sp. TRM 82003]